MKSLTPTKLAPPQKKNTQKILVTNLVSAKTIRTRSIKRLFVYRYMLMSQFRIQFTRLESEMVVGWLQNKLAINNQFIWQSTDVYLNDFVLDGRVFCIWRESWSVTGDVVSTIHTTPLCFDYRCYGDYFFSKRLCNNNRSIYHKNFLRLRCKWYYSSFNMVAVIVITAMRSLVKVCRVIFDISLPSCNCHRRCLLPPAPHRCLQVLFLRLSWQSARFHSVFVDA